MSKEPSCFTSATGKDSECANRSCVSNLKIPGEAVVNSASVLLEEGTSISKQSCLNILLVDDAVLIQKTTCRKLIKLGHSVEVAQNGADCLEKLKVAKLLAGSDRFTFDLIMMDLQMPVMDGLEATKRIRAQEKLMPPGDPVIMIGNSSNSSEGLRLICLVAGMDDYFDNPYRVEEVIVHMRMIKKIQKWLRKCLSSSGRHSKQESQWK